MPPARSLPVVAAAVLLLWGSPVRGEPGVLVKSPGRSAAEKDVGDEVEPVAIEVAPPAPTAVSPLPDEFRPGSGYGWRESPRTGRRAFHAGVDFLAPRGTRVRAPHAGVVQQIATDQRGRTRFGGYGNAVVVYHPDLERWSFYAHLDSVAVEVGDELDVDATIGAVGNTTNGRFGNLATHLHFEVRHARSDGRSPFPGTYRQFNEDPRAWLASLGVEFPTRRRRRRAEALSEGSR